MRVQTSSNHREWHLTMLSGLQESTPSVLIILAGDVEINPGLTPVIAVMDTRHSQGLMTINMAILTVVPPVLSPAMLVASKAELCLLPFTIQQPNDNKQEQLSAITSMLTGTPPLERHPQPVNNNLELPGMSKTLSAAVARSTSGRRPSTSAPTPARGRMPTVR